MKRVVVGLLIALPLLPWGAPAAVAVAPGQSTAADDTRNTTPVRQHRKDHPRKGNGPTAPDSPKTQWRGYWVDAFNPGLYAPGEVDKLVAEAKLSGANVLLVQASRHFDCLCNHSLYPRTEAAVDEAPYDPLSEIVARGHEAGLQVHAWVNVTRLWSGSTPPASPEHAFNRHGPRATGPDRWLNRRADGTESVGNNSYIDLGNPRALDHVVDAVLSIQTNYGVDGIHLDDIRYPDHSSGDYVNDWGYTDIALRRFREETGRQDRPAPHDDQWSQWRRDQVGNLVRRIYLRMFEQDPTRRLSINGIAYGHSPTQRGGFDRTRAHRNVLQDYRSWSREGFVDTVSVMNYKRNWVAEQAGMFSAWNADLRSLSQETGRYVVAGSALYLNAIPDSVAQARQVIDAGLGWNGYSYANGSHTASLSTNAPVKETQRELLGTALSTTVFPTPARVPAMPWKGSTGVLAGVVSLAGRTGDQVSIQVTPVGPSPDGVEGAAVAGRTRTLRTDGSGWFVAASLPPGRYRVRVAEKGVGALARTVRVRAGAVARADVTAWQVTSGE